MAHIAGLICALVGGWILLTWLSSCATQYVVDPIGHTIVDLVGY